MIRKSVACMMLCLVVVFAYAADTEDVFWESVVKGNVQEEYELYLKQYPKGRYVKEARRIVDGMREKARAQQEAKKQKQAQAEAAKWTEAEKKRREEEEEQRRQAEQEAMRPGRVFRDCGDCPEMVVIPAGSFEMGSNNGDSDEWPIHTVRIGRPFALGKTEVTQTQWRAVMGSNPSHFGGCDDCPVETVRWNDAQEFVRRLSQKTGKTYRLPSEAEWEYVCRAGGTHTYCGNDNVDAVAWYGSNSGSRTRPVAGRQPNALGLYDMSGNVWEWVEDCYNDSYNGAPTDGSAWTSGNCGARVVRGGSWYFSPRDVRAANRFRYFPELRLYDFGFRPARMLP